MKRFLSAVLALSLLSGTAAVAGPHGYGPGPRGGYHHGYDHGYRHHRDNDAGTAVAVGFGLLALTAIIAASENDRERDRGYRQEYVPPPPPPPSDYYGSNNGQPYGQTYQPGYQRDDDDDNGPGYGPQGPYDGDPQQ